MSRLSEVIHVVQYPNLGATVGLLLMIFLLSSTETPYPTLF